MAEKMREDILSIAGKVGGHAGLALRSLKSGLQVFYHEHDVFHAASIMKLPILVELFRQVDERKIALDDRITLTGEHKVGGAGIVLELHEGMVLTIRDLAILMIVVSDNSASNMLIDVVTMEKVNGLMERLGMKGSALRKKFMIELADPSIRNEMTPYDAMLILDEIYRGTVLSAESAREALSILCRQQYNEKIPLFLPEDLQVAHKTGEVSGVRHDAALVLLEHSPYILTVFTRDLADPLEGDRAIAMISKRVYDFFSPIP